MQKLEILLYLLCRTYTIQTILPIQFGCIFQPHQGNNKLYYVDKGHPSQFAIKKISKRLKKKIKEIYQ